MAMMSWIKQLATLLILTLVSIQLLYAAPFIPASNAQILETLPADSPAPRYLNANDFLVAPSMATAEQTSELLERAYLQGDPRALGQARAQLDQLTDQSIETLMLRARPAI